MVTLMLDLTSQVLMVGLMAVWLLRINVRLTLAMIGIGAGGGAAGAELPQDRAPGDPAVAARAWR